MQNQQRAHARELRACRLCGCMHRMPEFTRRQTARCSRCRSVIGRSTDSPTSLRVSAALAMAAIILYPAAVALPMLRLERLGHVQESSLLAGISTMYADGHAFIASIVLACSVVFPLGKLLGLLTLTMSSQRLGDAARAAVYRIIDWTGRWGMLDVLLVALLIAVVKLGDVAQVTPGPAVVTFGVCVLLSILAGATFKPELMWRDPQASSAGATKA